MDILGSSRTAGNKKEAASVPGSPDDPDDFVRRATPPLEIFNNGTEAHINDGPSLSTKQALFCLIRDHGSREVAAVTMLKEAELKKGLRVRVKYADNYPLPLTAPPSRSRFISKSSTILAFHPSKIRTRRSPSPG